MNRLEPIGVLAIGLETMIGSIATTQGISIAVLPAVFVMLAGMIVVAVGLYHP